MRPWENLFFFYKGKKYSASENHRSFKAWTGVLPDVAEKIFLKYFDKDFLPDRSRVLMVLNYLKTMPTEDEGSSNFKITRKTYRKRLWQSIHYLDFSMKEINLEDRYLDDVPRFGIFRNISLIVDATDCPIRRPSVRTQRELYSNGRMKENTYCRYNVKYTIACQISSGRICFVSGPDPGSHSDVVSFREGGLFSVCDREELFLCDKGYQGQPRCLTPYKKDQGALFLPPEQDAFNDVLSSVRILVECVIGRIKIFGITGGRGRFPCHNLEKHKTLFNVVCQITNLSLDFEPLRFNPNFYLV